MTFPPPAFFNLGKYAAAFEAGPIRDLLEAYVEHKRLADGAISQLRRGVVQLMRSAVCEWPAPIEEDLYFLITTREQQLADALITIAIARREVDRFGSPERLRFIIEPHDGGMIDQKMLDTAERYLRSIPTPQAMSELREEMAQLPRPANVWTPDYEVVISYEEELDEEAARRGGETH